MRRTVWNSEVLHVTDEHEGPKNQLQSTHQHSCSRMAHPKAWHARSSPSFEDLSRRYSRQDGAKGSLYRCFVAWTEEVKDDAMTNRGASCVSRQQAKAA